jgi:hypothetical protein
VGGRGVMVGVAGVVLIGLFVFFIHQTDTHIPPTHEVRVDLPNALKD